MTESLTTVARRANRLVHCYPPEWCARYGDEFTQLLLDEISERPRSLTRTIDVLKSGALARLTYAGVVGDALEPRRQVRAGLGIIGLSARAHSWWPESRFGRSCPSGGNGQRRPRRPQRPEC